MKIVVVMKDGDEYSTWFEGISDKDPLWMELVEKNGNNGMGSTGTLQEILEDLAQGLPQ